MTENQDKHLIIPTYVMNLCKKRYPINTSTKVRVWRDEPSKLSKSLETEKFPSAKQSLTTVNRAIILRFDSDLIFSDIFIATVEVHFAD
jgi:hypothetical protein